MDHLPNHLWVVPFSVFIAGILGSPHCMSMCGPIVLGLAKTRTALAAYQLGRMITYTFAGALFGAFGQTLLGPTRSPWIANMSLLTVASLLLYNGYRALSLRPIHFAFPEALNRFQISAWKKLCVPTNSNSFLAGSLTVLLPCGHLYSFLLGAVATGSAVKGAGFMFAFWLGSTPLLSFGSAWLRQLLRNQNEKARRWGGILLVAAGLFSILTFGVRSFEIYNAGKADSAAHSQHGLLRCH